MQRGRGWPVKHLFVIGCLGLVACGGDDDGAVKPRGAGNQLQAIAPQPRNPHNEFQPRSEITRSPTAPIQVVQPTVGTNTPSAKQEVTPTRDLKKELAAAFGNPADCLRNETTLAGKLSISISSTVAVTGRATRGTASAPGVSAASLDCLKQKASRVRLRGPVPGAPLTISTKVELNISQTVTKKTETVPQETGFALQEGQQAVQGASGVAIDPTQGQVIKGPKGTPYVRPSGSPISGPSGTPIGK